MTPPPDRGKHALLPRIAAIVLGSALAIWSLSDPPAFGGGPGFRISQAVVLAFGLLVTASALLPVAWTARVLALAISALLSLAAAEAALRITVGPRYETLHEFDPVTLFRLRPNGRRDHVRGPAYGGEHIAYRINSLGYRGDELRPSPDARVVVFGDSFIQADFSNDRDTFAKRLEVHLSAALKEDIEVVNAGVASFGPDQVLKRLPRDLELLRPQLVILGVFTGNDFGDLVRNKLYRLGADGELVETHTTVSPELERMMRSRRGELLIKTLARRLVAQPGAPAAPDAPSIEAMTPAGRLEFFREEQQRAYDEYVIRGDDVIRAVFSDYYDADVSLTPTSPSAQFKTRLMDRVLERIFDTTQRAGVPLLIMPIPHPLDVESHYTGEVDLARYPQYRRENLVGAIEETAQRLEIPCVDLFSAFQRRGSRALYFEGVDDHWNAAGQDLAAALVAQLVLETPSLSSALSAKSGE